VVAETAVTTEETVLTEEATLSSDAREPLPMPTASAAAAQPVLSVVPVVVPTESIPAVRADTPGVPVTENTTPRTGVYFGLSVVAFGGLIALFHADHRKERGKPEEEA
jgi:hypothetical protein